MVLRLIALLPIFFACFSLVAGPVSAQSDAANVVAEVGDEKITLVALHRAEQRLRRYGPDQDRRELLQPFIDREILWLEAKRMGLHAESRVQRTLDKIRRRQLAEKVYTEEVTRKVSVVEEEVRQYYDEYGLGQKKEVRASHILLHTPAAVEAAVERLAAGGDFAVLAQEVSQDSATAAIGGDTGFWQEEDAQKSPFVQHFIGLNVGEVAKPYRNARGNFHLIQVTEHRLLGFEHQQAQIQRILERKRKKERWTAYLEQAQARFQLVVDEVTLEFLLGEGRYAVNKMAPIDAADHGRVLVIYKGGEIDLSAYVEMVKNTNTRDRPRAVDSTAVVRFAIRETMQQVVLPLIAEAQNWDQAEGVVSHMAEKRAQAMVEMLRRVKVEEPILTEEIRRAYYQDHQPDFLESDRMFFEGGLLESADKAAQVIARVRQGEKLAVVMKDYPVFSEQWRKYDVFHFSPNGKSNHGARWDKAVEAVRSLESGAVGGPVELAFEGEARGYLVVQALALRPAQILSYDDPLVQAEVWRQTRFAHRDEINRSFFSYLQELRRQYEPVVVVYDEVLNAVWEVVD